MSMIEIRLKKDSDVFMTLPEGEFNYLLSPLQLKYALKYEQQVNGFHFKKIENEKIKKKKIKKKKINKLVVHHKDKPNDLMFFRSQYQASRELNLGQPNISAHLSGKRKNVKGFIFKKINIT